jgi:hypothetical protein
MNAARIARMFARSDTEVRMQSYIRPTIGKAVLCVALMKIR